MKKIFFIIQFCLYINLLYGQQTESCDDKHKIGIIQSTTDCNGNWGILCFPRNNQESFHVQITGPEQYIDEKHYEPLMPNVCFETPYAGIYTIEVQGEVCTFDVGYESIKYGSLFDQSPPTRNIRTDKKVGTIQGSQSVSLTGGATYSIPISLPSGTNGMEPSLSVNYNSQAGVGLLGYGWSLGIGSAITRVAKDIYNDGIVEPVKLYTTDAFALDGKRLVLLEGVYSEAGSTYTTKEETFSKITMLNDVASDGFIVESKNGQKIYYGTTENSRIIESNGRRVITWQISKIADNFGNYVEFKYKKVHDNYLLDEVNYTGNSSIGLDPYHKIKFEYRERLDKNTVYNSGLMINLDYLLTKIKVISEGQKFSEYDFSYGHDNIHSYLTEVTLTNGILNGEKLNSTRFTYGRISSVQVEFQEKLFLKPYKIKVY